MSHNAAARLYALIHSTEADTASEHAALHAALALGNPGQAAVHALVVAERGSLNASIEAAKTAGVSDITAVACDGTEPLQPHQLAGLFVHLLNQATAAQTSLGENADGKKVLLASAGTMVEEAAGAIAAGAGAVPLGRPAHIELTQDGAISITRSAYGGRLDIQQTIEHSICLAAVRTSAVCTAADTNSPESGADIPVQVLPRPALPEPYAKRVGAQTETEANLEGARIVVSGGRGMNSEEGFKLLRQLARRLGGAVGASLPAVDAGWAPVSRQIGQSGKYVSPGLYLAVGISGTPQHLAGIDPHSAIIAINKSDDAPIFQVAQVGIVAPWEEMLPALLEALQEEPAPVKP